MTRTWSRLIRRFGGAALALVVAGMAAYNVGMLFRAERAVTGGEICLPLDDSFIYLQYARAIAEGHPFVYTPGNAPTTGATSLLYPLLLAPPHWIRLAPSLCIAWALALGFIGYVWSALLIARIGRLVAGLPGAFLALVAFLQSPFLLWGYMSGMEIPLYGTVLLATFLLYLKERDAARFPILRWWLFVLAAARPEGAVLAGVFGLLMLFDRRRAAHQTGGPPMWEPALLLPFVAAALPFLVNLVVTGSIEATSSQAKSILAEPYRETRATYLAGLPQVWVAIGKVYLAMLQLAESPRLPSLLGAVNGASVLAFAVLSFLPRRRPWTGGIALLPLVGAGILVNSLPVYWYVHLYRYLQGLYPLVLVLFAAGWGRLAWLAWDRLPRALGAPLVAGLVLLPLVAWAPRLLPSDDWVVPFYGHNCENILHQQVTVGRWIDRNLTKDAIVGLNDAGAIAYYGRRQTVDLLGLTSAGYARVYRSGLGCLFEHVRREPAGRRPTYFVIYPEWFPYWRGSGLLGPESFRAHLGFNTICGGPDMVVYPASWVDIAATDRPETAAAGTRTRRPVDSIDFAWLPDEERHEWRADPEAKDVLRQYTYRDRPTRPMTDGGRIVPGSQRFRTKVLPGRDLLVVLRTDAWYSSRIQISVDGRSAGVWSIPRSDTAWIEPSFQIPGALLRRSRPEFVLRREETGDNGNLAPFHVWMYQ